MGDIKDIVDLCIKLREEASDRKIVAAVERIQTLLLSFQSAQVSLMEKYSSQTLVNIDLARRCTALEGENAKLKSDHASKKHRLVDDYEFIPAVGLYQEKDGRSGLFLCGKCLSNEIVSHVQERSDGWKCRTCNEFFTNPNRSVPPLQRGMATWRPYDFM